MTLAARLVLETGLTLPACDGLPRDGWTHFCTVVAENGGRFRYDHEDGYSLALDTPAPGMVMVASVERFDA